MSPRKPTKAKCKEPTPPRWTVADGLEEELRSAEDVARGVLAEHAGRRAEVFAQLNPSAQESYRLFARMGALQFLEHDEPLDPGSRRKTPMVCRRCEAAKRLLLWAGELRLALANGAPEVAIGYALDVGRLEVQLGLTFRDGVFYHEKQGNFSHHKRGPYVEEKKRRNQKILEWNGEFAKYPSGKARPRKARVLLILGRCEDEARAVRLTNGEAKAKVWKIGAASIIRVISPPKNKSKNS